MKAKLVENNINFERGLEPKDSLGIGTKHGKKKLLKYLGIAGKRIFEKGEEDMYELTNAVHSLVEDKKTSITLKGEDIVVIIDTNLEPSVNWLLLKAIVNFLDYVLEDWEILGTEENILNLTFHES